MKKIVKVIVIIFIGLCFISNTVLAVNPILFPEAFKPSIGLAEEGGPFLTISNKIISITSYIGSGVAAVVILLIGIKYVLGSVEEKAQYKETLKPYLIGCVMVFGIFAILNVAQAIMIGMFKGV